VQDLEDANASSAVDYFSKVERKASGRNGQPIRPLREVAGPTSYPKDRPLGERVQMLMELLFHRLDDRGLSGQGQLEKPVPHSAFDSEMRRMNMNASRSPPPQQEQEHGEASASAASTRRGSQRGGSPPPLAGVPETA
jgi:hypothetical protein